jgi:hypothetical protein
MSSRALPDPARKSRPAPTPSCRSENPVSGTRQSCPGYLGAYGKWDHNRRGCPVYYYAGAPAYCEEAVKIEMKKNLSTIIAAAIVASLFMLPADARPKKQKRPDPQRRHEVQTQTPSLDGRITGRTRTCWFETLQYDGLGVPYGPYCH